MTGLQFLNFIQDNHGIVLFSTERPVDKEEGIAHTRISNSELKRWLARGTVLLNGEVLQAHHEVTLPVNSLVIHPRSDHRRTIW